MIVWNTAQARLIGTQETVIDCPSREQGFYVGDGHPIARWISMVSGVNKYMSFQYS